MMVFSYPERNNEENIMSGEKKWDTVLRNGEKRTPTFRSRRVFAVGSNWYFSTRENKDQGPFMSRDMAEKAIESYIQRHRTLKTRKSVNHTVDVFKYVKDVV